MKADLGGEDSRWLIVEDGFTAGLTNTYETLFTTGNGYLGTRGSLAEGHEGALPGTFLRGVFDHHDSAVTDLVKAPDWLSLAVVAGGVRLDVTSASVVRHRRILDMREGAVFRDTVFEDWQGRRTRFETVHFASSADQHLSCLQARITPENHTAPISVHSGIDGTGYNLDRRPIYTEPPPDDPHMKWHKWAQSQHLDEVAPRATPRRHLSGNPYHRHRHHHRIRGAYDGIVGRRVQRQPAVQIHRAGVTCAGGRWRHAHSGEARRRLHVPRRRSRLRPPGVPGRAPPPYRGRIRDVPRAEPCGMAGKVGRLRRHDRRKSRRDPRRTFQHSP